MERIEKTIIKVGTNNIDVVTTINGIKCNTTARVKPCNADKLINALISANIPVTISRPVITTTNIGNGIITTKIMEDMITITAGCSGETIHRILEEIKNNK